MSQQMEFTLEYSARLWQESMALEGADFRKEFLSKHHEKASRPESRKTFETRQNIKKDKSR